MRIMLDIHDTAIPESKLREFERDVSEGFIICDVEVGICILHPRTIQRRSWKDMFRSKGPPCTANGAGAGAADQASIPFPTSAPPPPPVSVDAHKQAAALERCR